MLIAHIIIYKLDLISIQIQGKENHEALIQYSDNPIDKYKDTTQHIHSPRNQCKIRAQPMMQKCRYIENIKTQILKRYKIK